MRRDSADAAAELETTREVRGSHAEVFAEGLDDVAGLGAGIVDQRYPSTTCCLLTTREAP
jgi:hypothetical protein